MARHDDAPWRNLGASVWAPHATSITTSVTCPWPRAAAKPWGRPASRNANMAPNGTQLAPNDTQMSQKGAQRTAKTILKVVPVKGVFRTLTGTARFDQLWTQSDPNGDPLAPIDAQSEPNGDQICQSGAQMTATGHPHDHGGDSGEHSGAKVRQKTVQRHPQDHPGSAGPPRKRSTLTPHPPPPSNGRSVLGPSSWLTHQSVWCSH